MEQKLNPIIQDYLCMQRSIEIEEIYINRSYNKISTAKSIIKDEQRYIKKEQRTIEYHKKELSDKNEKLSKIKIKYDELNLDPKITKVLNHKIRYSSNKDLSRDDINKIVDNTIGYIKYPEAYTIV